MPAGAVGTGNAAYYQAETGIAPGKYGREPEGARAAGDHQAHSDPAVHPAN